MIPDRENQGNPHTNPIFTIVNPSAAEITACRLRRFLDDTIGADALPSDLAWMEILPPTHDRRFVDNLSRAFPEIPLSASDRTALSFSPREPRLFTVVCGPLTLVCVVGPSNGSAADCAFLPLWTTGEPATEPPPWLFTFDVAAVIHAVEDLRRRRAPWPC